MVASQIKVKNRNRIPVPMGERIADVFIIIITLFVCFTMVYPIMYILKQSFSSADTVGLANLSLLPVKWSFEGYNYVLSNSNIWRGYANTIHRTVLSTILGLIVSIGYAYPLSKRDLPFRKGLTMLIVATMFIGGGMIPSYILVSNLGLRNTIWSMVLPKLAKAYNIVIMRNFFMSLPKELDEAAEIDGCNTLQTLIRVMLPLSSAILATIGLWIIVENWNAWFDCLLYVTDSKLYVIQVVLRKIIVETSSEVQDTKRLETVSADVVKYCTIIAATLPILMVYPFLQKYFIKGIITGSLKG
ncbi:MAG: carbohydrate ABC transporter permease [Christensenellales bacterium]|jgi:putative aldouronate transport system permease protein